MPPEGDGEEKSTGQESGKGDGQAVTLPEHLVGEIDAETFTNLPAEAREALSATVKSLKGAYTRKFQDVADLRKLKEGLEADPEKAATVKRAVAEYEARKAGILPDSKKDSQATQTRLETLLEGIEPAERKAIKEFVESLDERYHGQLKATGEEILELKRLLTGLQSTHQLSRQESLETQLKGLPESYKALAEQHKDEIMQLGLQPSMTKYSAERLLQIVAEPSAYRKAVLASPEDRDKEVKRAKQTATSPPTSAVKSVESLIGKEDIVKSRSRNFGDQINIGNVIRKLVKDIKGGAGA